MPRILVLDASSRQALAATRGLGRAGFDVGVAGYRGGELATYSRYARRSHVLADPRTTPLRFSEALAATIVAHRYDALVATDDATLAQLATKAVSIPSVPTLGAAYLRLTDKLALVDVCARADVPYPQTRLVQHDDDLRAALASLPMPVYVKGARSAEATADGVRHQMGAHLALDADAARRGVDAVHRAGLRAIVQPRIAVRTKINVGLLRSQGRTLAAFPYVSIRDVPPTGGIAAAVESVSADSDIGALATGALERVCDAAGYEGLAQAECAVTSDGVLYLIEVNPRLWASVWLAERLGARIIERSVRLALGLPQPPPAREHPGVRFHNLRAELRWLVQRRDRLGALRELSRTTGPSDVFEYVDPTDIGATLRHVARFIARRGRA